MVTGDGKAKLAFHGREKEKKKKEKIRDVGEFGAASAKALRYRAGRCLTCAPAPVTLPPEFDRPSELHGASGVQGRSWAVVEQPVCHWLGCPVLSCLSSSLARSGSRKRDLVARARGCGSQDAGRVFPWALGSASNEKQDSHQEALILDADPTNRGLGNHCLERGFWERSVSGRPAAGMDWGGRIWGCFLVLATFCGQLKRIHGSGTKRGLSQRKLFLKNSSPLLLKAPAAPAVPCEQLCCSPVPKPGSPRGPAAGCGLVSGEGRRGCCPRFSWWINSWQTSVAVPIVVRTSPSLSLPVQALADIPCVGGGQGERWGDGNSPLAGLQEVGRLIMASPHPFRRSCTSAAPVEHGLRSLEEPWEVFPPPYG